MPLAECTRSLARNCAAPIDAKNGAEAKNWRDGKPVRVIRSFKGRKHSKYCPEDGYRYDGIYKLVKYWPEKGKSGFLVWRYLLRRDDKSPAPWTAAGKLAAEKLGLCMQYPEGYLESQDGDANNSGAENDAAAAKGKGKRSRELHYLHDVVLEDRTLYMTSGEVVGDDLLPPGIQASYHEH
ncbi:hypothetical protein HPB50_017595 [Hyalomma asiaticum]|uniref:Uncharacterized protein n=1 Tax=Hyalomma asiaticum TaxID=266040 RepID=A0ACB7TMH1_HYAAI|nr:hypothetical protein HPB50_017595 [Hyalomma asiaticum]